MKRFAKDALFWMPALVLFAIFLGPVCVGSRSFVRGDFSVQHWPWGQYLYDTFRAGSFPFWTQAMAGGFPLAAEGQVAAFYGPHRALFALMPFWGAYSSSIVLHFLAGVLGFYIFCRTVHLSRAGAGLAALVYAFGSNYAGCYYNTGSLRVLAWLPYALWILDRMRHRPAPSRLALGSLCALIVSQMWNAGFSQIALYGMGFAWCFALLNVRRPGGAAVLGVYSGAVVLGTLLSAPQMALTMELIGQSVRQDETVAFALWGSVPPTSLVSLLFPEWGTVQRVSFYAGVPALLALCAYGLLPRARRDYRPLILFAIFLLLSLGKLNPLYTALVQALDLTLLRNPAKFLFFAGLSLAWMAGLGFDALLLALKRRRAEKILPAVAALAVLGALLPALCRGVWMAARPLWESWSASYLQAVLNEKGGSAAPAQQYRLMLDSFYGRLGELFSYTHAHTAVASVLILTTAFLAWLAVRRRMTRKVFLASILCLAAIDLYYFGRHLGAGFIGNAGAVSETDPDERVRFLQAAQQADPGPFAEFVLDPLSEFLPPNRSMAYGLEHPGGYSPLLLKDYYDLTRELGIVDGSTGRAPFVQDAWTQSRGLLDLIGIQHLASDAVLPWEGFRETGRVGGTLFYRNAWVLPPAGAWTRAVTIADAAERLAYMKSSAFQPREMVVVERDTGLPVSSQGGVFKAAEIMRWEDGRALAIFTLPEEGIGWVRIAAYPGWRVWVNGQPQPWFKVHHAFIGFRLEPGVHQVELSYAPTHYRQSLAVSALAALLILAGAWRFFFRTKTL